MKLPTMLSGNTNPEILFLDTSLIIVSKPAGLRTIPDGYTPDLPCLVRMLQEQAGPIFVVHRLDKDTSGVMVFARSPEAHRHLNSQFEHRLVQKSYHASISGTPSWEATSIDTPLRVNGDRNHRTIADAINGKSARTDLRIIRQQKFTSLVSARPRTGYTHQIRSHLASIAHPVQGDILYHSMPDNSPAYPAKRLMLHAYTIQFTHPVTNELISFTSPYPPDFLEVLAHNEE